VPKPSAIDLTPPVERAFLLAVDTGDDEPLGFNIDIGKILRDATTTRKTTRRRSSTTSRSTSGDMDDAVRRAVRAELADVKRGLKALAEEVVRLRKANEELSEKVARSIRR
jgi:hypothetical protein